MLTINEDTCKYMPETAGKKLTLENSVFVEKVYSDQNDDLDKLHEKLTRFIKKKDGFFIEVGAGDGLKQSRTVRLENSGWRGMLIEPVIEQCARCKINRPKAAVLNYDLVARDHPEKWVKQDEVMRQGTSRRVKGNPRTLTSILDEFQVERIDLLVLNGEGNGLDVLKGLDLLHYRPEYILVKESLNGEVFPYLSRYCYELSEELCTGAYTRKVLYRSINNNLDNASDRAISTDQPTGVENSAFCGKEKTGYDASLTMHEAGTQPTESGDEHSCHRLSDLKVIDMQQDGTVKIIPINESPNYLCLLKLGTPEFDEIYYEYERRQLLLNKNYKIRDSSYYLELLDRLKKGFDSNKQKIKVSNNVVWDGYHRVCILYYLYGPEFKLGPDVIDSKKANLIISTSRGTNIYIDENSVITQDFIMPEFVSGVTDIEDWIKLGINGFKEWYQPVDFGNGIVAHVTTPPDWKAAPEWDQYRGLAKWESIVKRHIPDVPGKRVLDLGCNNGIISLQLARMGAAGVIGIDRDANIRQKTFDCLPEQDIVAQANFVKKAFEILNGVEYPVTYIACDISRLSELELGRFDLILALCVVYHELDRTPQLIRQLSTMTDHIILQANLGHTGDLGEWAHPARLAKLLMDTGFTRIEIDAPQGYIFPIVVGKR